MIVGLTSGRVFILEISEELSERKNVDSYKNKNSFNRKRTFNGVFGDEKMIGVQNLSFKDFNATNISSNCLYKKLEPIASFQPFKS